MKNLQTLFDHAAEFARHTYSDKNGDFDMSPMLLCWTRRGTRHGMDYMVLITDSPLDAASVALDQIKQRNDAIEMACFVSAAWTKSPEGARTGETLIIVAETTNEQISGNIEVTRDADGSITLGETQVAVHAVSRIPLLYKPTEH